MLYHVMNEADAATINEHAALLKAVREMRAAQKEYFKARSYDALDKSKKLEKQVDELIKPEEPTNQLTLL